MDSEPFVATPEKPGAGDIKGDSLTTFKRSLFGEGASHEHNTQKEIKHSEDGVCSMEGNKLELPTTLGDEASSWAHRRADPSSQKDDFSFGFKSHDTFTQAQPERLTDMPECGHLDLLGSFRMKGPADSQQGDKQTLTELGSREEPRIRGTLSANQRPSSESTVPHTPIKARRLDIDSGSGAIFTPPPAPVSSFISQLSPCWVMRQPYLTNCCYKLVERAQHLLWSVYLFCIRLLGVIWSGLEGVLVRLSPCLLCLSMRGLRFLTAN